MSGIYSFINRIHVVKQIPIFKELNWFDVRRVASKAIISEYKKGDLISKEGEPPDYFYCLVSGRLEAYTSTSDGHRENVDFIHRGIHFGVISVLTGENHPMSFEAINDSVVLKISKDDFNDILKSMPQLAIELSQSLSRRMRRKVTGSKRIFESMVISVYCPVKGVGSSAYAMNLALSLEEETQKRVVFVSIASRKDKPVKTASSEMHVSPCWKNQELDLNQIVGDHEKILDSVIKGELKIDLLNVSFDPKDVSLKDEIGSFVSALVGDYHYVIVDLPNEMDEVVLETLTHVDMVNLITSDRKKDFELMSQVIKRLKDVLKGNFHQEKVRVIVRSVHDKVYLSFEEMNQCIGYDVCAVLPNIKSDELTVKVDSNSLFFLRSDHKSEYAQSIRRIARDVGKVSIGLVLGGGAALGVAHIGVLRVLEKEEIPIDVIVGSSMGALIGSFWAIGMSVDDIEKLAREFERKRGMLKLVDPVFPISGLIGGRAIKHWLKKSLGARTFYNVKIPFKAIAYDLVRREEIVIDSGSIVDAVRQSISIPGVIEPVKKKDQIIIDGGVLNPLPTNVLVRRGIKKIIAVNVLQSPEHVSDGFDMEQHHLKEAMAVPFFKAPIHFLSIRVAGFLFKPFKANISDIIVRTLQASEYVIAEQNAQQADVLIHPNLVGLNWYELYRVDDLIQKGEDATRQLLPEIKRLVAE